MEQKLSYLVLIADKKEGFQIPLADDALNAVAFMEGLMPVDIEYFMGRAKSFDGFEVEQQVVQLFQLTLH